MVGMTALQMMLMMITCEQMWNCMSIVRILGT
jgi:hypothetical protein